MNRLQKGLITAGATAGTLALIVRALTIPILPEDNYTFIASPDQGTCEVVEDKQSLASVVGKLLGADNSKEESNIDDRVVRIKGGTGYEIGPGYILTNDHIARAYIEGLLKPPILVFSGNGSDPREGVIVEQSRAYDLALIAVSPRKLNGEVKLREHLPLNSSVTLRTINPTDSTYSRKSSRIDINAISEYNFPPTTADLQGNTSAGIRYTTDIFTGAGMSGSTITDQNSSIVGVYSTGGANLTRELGYVVPYRAVDPFKKTEELRGKYPDAEFFFSSTEPSSIIKFLQEHCNKPKDSIVRFPGNSKARHSYEKMGYGPAPKVLAMSGR